eukprot:CAMPEP_0181122630 /NCGR_PEP_ID=MMETSP1071-20121207/25422_1 /TAXON_ID=35127 /ORGANISM="Thalassiosira sp., Strain NH16" /LENGTH=194 /DNA_ID=CAMNT_0023207625 /DNA_START=40 /DNA_END=624 /DNA_ORIENTATION=-
MTAVLSSTRWVTLLLIVAYTAAAASSSGRFVRRHKISPTAPSHSSIPPSLILHHRLHQFRGGAIADDSDEEYDDAYDSEYDEESDDDEPIVTTAKKLAASTKAVAQKKKAAAIKSKVKVVMASSSSTKSVSVLKKGSNGSLYKRYVPYIIRACVNPFTLIAMTKAYFVSLCDINYLKEVSFIFLAVLSFFENVL